MPLPQPRAGEQQQAFISRCIRAETNASPDRDSKQIAAMCYQAWRDRNKESHVDKPQPHRRIETTESCRLTEVVEFGGVEFEENDSRRLIKGVVLLGPESANGYTYTQQAMLGAVQAGYYEDCRAFLNHPKAGDEKNGRDVRDLAGVFVNTRIEDGKVKGDLKVLPDSTGDKFWNIARHMPHAASCSHVAYGPIVGRAGKRYVEEIKKVVSVDLVVQGATTQTVFESHNQETVMEYDKVQLDELRTARPDLIKTLLAEGAASRDEEVQQLADENQELKKTNDEYLVEKEQAKKAAEVEQMLTEAKLPDKAKTDVFRETLMGCEGDNWQDQAKQLIDDRKALLGGVQHMGGEKTVHDSDHETIDFKRAYGQMIG